MIWNQLSWFAVPALSLWILGVLLAQRKGSPAPWAFWWAASTALWSPA